MSRFFLSESEGALELSLDGRTIFRHTARRPFITAGAGEAEYRMFRGNFSTTDRVTERFGLPEWEITRGGGQAKGVEQAKGAEEGGAAKGSESAQCVGDGAIGDSVELAFFRGPDRITMKLYTSRAGRVGPEDAGLGVDLAGARDDCGEESLVIEFTAAPARLNRFSFRMHAEPGEAVWGCGEQFSHFNLRGRRFPLWTSEQGVGRNKRTLITRLADAAEGAGGDYWWTFYPQTSYVTGRRLRVHVETPAWAEFDFRGSREFILRARALPSRIVLGTGNSFEEIARGNAAYFGRQPPPPDWVHDGVILGIQGGAAICEEKLDRAQAAGVPVAGIWAQDWEGVRFTSFGKRLAWNWQPDGALYPGIADFCARLKERGVRFLAYANCYLACDKPLFAEAEALGVLVKDREGRAYRFDAGEFDAGIPDLTNPAGREWFKKVLRENLIDNGISGWMADFGEYMPVDCVLHDGTPADMAHNVWPALWARVNFEALAEAGKLDDITYFMRAGAAGSQRWCPLMWAGDQNVDWSRDDGIASVIPAALSLAMLGHGFHHSDLGGYTTLFTLKRTRELFLRWAELSAFTVMMRSHEGNRPTANHQFDSDAATLAGLARMGRLRRALAPYFRALSAECAERGTPVLRPLFMLDEGDGASYEVQDQFAVGENMVVAPVLRRGARSRRLRLPAGTWTHLWSGTKFEGRAWVEVPAPIGEPPAFVRAGSAWEAVALEAAKAAGAAGASPA